MYQFCSKYITCISSRNDAMQVVMSLIHRYKEMSEFVCVWFVSFQIRTEHSNRNPGKPRKEIERTEGHNLAVHIARGGVNSMQPTTLHWTLDLQRGCHAHFHCGEKCCWKPKGFWVVRLLKKKEACTFILIPISVSISQDSLWFFLYYTVFAAFVYCLKETMSAILARATPWRKYVVSIQRQC